MSHVFAARGFPDTKQIPIHRVSVAREPWPTWDRAESKCTSSCGSVVAAPHSFLAPGRLFPAKPEPLHPNGGHVDSRLGELRNRSRKPRATRAHGAPSLEGPVILTAGPRDRAG